MYFLFSGRLLVADLFFLCFPAHGGVLFSSWCLTEWMASDTSGWFSEAKGFPEINLLICADDLRGGSGRGMSTMDIICYGIKVFDILWSREIGFSEM